MGGLSWGIKKFCICPGGSIYMLYPVGGYIGVLWGVWYRG